MCRTLKNDSGKAYKIDSSDLVRLRRATALEDRQHLEKGLKPVEPVVPFYVRGLEIMEVTDIRQSEIEVTESLEKKVLDALKEQSLSKEPCADGTT